MKETSTTGLECLRLGASDYISKPINSDALEVALDRAYERRETWFRFKRYDKELEIANKNKAYFSSYLMRCRVISLCRMKISGLPARTSDLKKILVIISDHTATKSISTGLNPAWVSGGSHIQRWKTPSNRGSRYFTAWGTISMS